LNFNGLREIARADGGSTRHETRHGPVDLTGPEGHVTLGKWGDAGWGREKELQTGGHACIKDNALYPLTGAESLPGFTSKELAQIISIASKDDDISSSMERIRHWTSEGLLTPSGEKNPGTGRKRFYDREGMYMALILNELANWGLGIRQTNQSYFREAFALAKRAARTIDEQAVAEIEVILIINRDSSLENPKASLFEGQSPLQLQIESDSLMVINLTKLLTRTTRVWFPS
jgi:hypothetical protein